MAGLLLLHSFVAVAWLHGATGLREGDFASGFLVQDEQMAFEETEGDLPSGLLAEDQQMAFEETEGDLPSGLLAEEQQMAFEETEGNPMHRRLVRERAARAKKRKAEQKAAKKRKEEKARKEAALKRARTVDCEWNETWGAPGECSAKCGGGLHSEPLQKRWVTKQQDAYGYGKKCPGNCSSEEEDKCAEERYFPCNAEPCPSDCSVVDLGNRVQGPGTATAWQGGGLGCVYQFWQVEGKELKLLAETDPQREGAFEPEVRALEGKVDDSGKRWPYGLSTTDKRRIVLGFRSCEKPVPEADSSGQRSIAKVCMWGSVGFQDHSQSRSLSSKEKELLEDYRRSMDRGNSGKVGWSGSLKEQAGKGISGETAGVTFEGDTQEPTEAAYTLQVTMAAQPPYPPELAEEQTTQVEGGVRLVLSKGSNDNGAEVEGYRVFARKVFNTRPGKDRGRGHCKLKLLPNCQEGLQVPCVDKELTLRHFPPGSALEVHVGAVNSVGNGTWVSEKAIARTSVKAGESWDKCPVDRWTSLEDSKKKAEQESSDEGPEEGEPHCLFTAPPVPQCRMKERTDWKGSTKCDGKRYWQTFRPVDKDGKDLTGCAGKLQGICTHVVSELGVKKCEDRGCGKTLGLFKTKQCCCHAGTGDEEDSQDCACESETCESLGLVPAADEEKSCRS